MGCCQQGHRAHEHEDAVGVPGLRTERDAQSARLRSRDCVQLRHQRLEQPLQRRER